MTQPTAEQYTPRRLDARSEGDKALVTEALNYHPMVSHETVDYFAGIYPCLTGYVLWWTDGVANDWSEYLPTYPLALTRFALLIDAGARGAFYSKTMDEFVTDVRGLFDGHAR